jgi:hypothetical protein
MIDLTLYLPAALIPNYRKFCGSCLAAQFALAITAFDRRMARAPHVPTVRLTRSYEGAG